MKVFVLGDSISIQYGPYLAQALHGVMDYARKEGESEALLNLDDPQGANGGDSSMTLAFLSAMASTGGINADILLLNCGLHDIKTDPKTLAKQVPFEDYKKNLHVTVKLVNRMGLDLVWVRTTPCDERVHNQPDMAFFRFAADNLAYNRAADEIMAGAGVPSVDLHTFTGNLGPDLYIDHVHFHEHIRTMQGAFIAGWLNSHINK